MNYRCNISAIAFVTLCMCVVLCRNVENARQKRGTSNDDKNCENVKPFFKMLNISVQPFDEPKGSICSGECCGPDIERDLRKQGQKDFAILLRHNSRTLQGLLTTMSSTLQNHITELAKQSENYTSMLTAQVYRDMFPSIKNPIRTLYSDIRRYVQLNGSRDAFLASNIDIKSTVTQFFVDLFPVAYQHTIDASLTKEFSVEYQSCVKNTFSEAQPFGDIPRQVAQSLSKSLESTMLLLQALEIGIEVLNATDTLITEDNGKSNVQCYDALMKMTYCPKCLGLKGAAKPCSGYCLNVLRGCLSKYVAELDSPWNGYVEGIERLVTAMKQQNNEAGVNADFVIRGLDTKVSEAIMHAMKRTDIDSRIKRTCGPTKYSEVISTTARNSNSEVSTTLGSKSKRVFTPMPLNEFGKFLVSIARSKNFYDNLADSLCEDDSFAERKDQHCWTGERIGEYTKTVVDASLDTQKYNPEVKLNTDLQNVDPRVAQLVDKLRHVLQMVISSLGAVSLPEPDNFMQGDGAEGSGSGGGSEFGDDDGSTGSGSGDGPITDIHGPSQDNNGKRINIQIEDVTSPRPAGGSSFISPSSLLTAIVLLSTFVMKYFA